MEKLQPFVDKSIEKMIELKILSRADQAQKLREILSQTRIPIWIVGIIGSGALLRFYLMRKWSYWKERGIDGPDPSISKFRDQKTFQIVQIVRYLQFGSLIPGEVRKWD